MTKGEKRIKVCTRCGAEFTARTDNAMYCVDCKPIVRRQQAALHRERKKVNWKNLRLDRLRNVLRLQSFCEKLNAITESTVQATVTVSMF